MNKAIKLTSSLCNAAFTVPKFIHPAAKLFLYTENGCVNKLSQTPRGVTPSYKLYRYVPPHRVGFLRRYGLKTGVHFSHFDLFPLWFSRELRECMNVIIVSIPYEQE